MISISDFLKKLDNGSKKKLIIKLTESIEEIENTAISLKDLSGAWKNSRDSDVIMKEIRNSRVNKQDSIEF